MDGGIIWRLKMEIKTVSSIAFETKALINIKPGGVFRLAHIPLIEALKENAFYMVLDAPEIKNGILVANINDGKQMKRDADHRVIEHNAKMNLSV